MHFLSHYFTEPANPSTLHTIGLILPDLTPHFSKIHNSKANKTLEPTDKNLMEIHVGIHQHYEGDKWFHASKLFEKSTKNAVDYFLAQGLNRNRLRLSVIAHLAVEMMIDRQILLQHPGVCDQFYRKVNDADEHSISLYFDRIEQPLAKQQFFYTFKFFKQRRFLFMFNELENVLFGLSKVYESVTGTAFTEDEKQQFFAALHNIDSEIRYSWQQILKR